MAVGTYWGATQNTDFVPGYKMVGARRYRASKLAEKPSIPARIVKLSDSESLELRIIELSEVEM